MAYVTTMKKGDRVQIGPFTLKMCRVMGKDKARLRIELPDDERIEKLPNDDDPKSCNTTE